MVSVSNGPRIMPSMERAIPVMPSIDQWLYPHVNSKSCIRSSTRRRGAYDGRLAQLVRAPALQAGGRRFESCTAHHIRHRTSIMVMRPEAGHRRCMSPYRASGVVVQLVRTLPCHGRGRGFESRRPRHFLSSSYKEMATRSSRCSNPHFHWIAPDFIPNAARNSPCAACVSSPSSCV